MNKLINNNFNSFLKKSNKDISDIFVQNNLKNNNIFNNNYIFQKKYYNSLYVKLYNILISRYIYNEKNKLNQNNGFNKNNGLNENNSFNKNNGLNENNSFNKNNGFNKNYTVNDKEVMTLLENIDIDKLFDIMNNNEKIVNETVSYNFNDTTIKEFIKKVFDEYL